MHTCPECGEVVATRGGLGLHAQAAHSAVQPAAPHPAPPPAHETPVVRPATPAVDRRRVGLDPTVPLTALLVLVLLVGAIAAALQRSSPGQGPPAPAQVTVAVPHG